MPSSRPMVLSRRSLPTWLPRSARRAALVSLATLALPAFAEADRNVYVSNIDSDNVSAFDITASGSLTALGNSPFPAGNDPDRSRRSVPMASTSTSPTRPRTTSPPTTLPPTAPLLR